MKRLLDWLRRRRCRHVWKVARIERTGRLCFSFNCARPGLRVTEECARCGVVRVDESTMSGTESLPLTPEVARRVLCDEFGWSRSS